jgi:hypothetical protein
MVDTPDATTQRSRLAEDSLKVAAQQIRVFEVRNRFRHRRVMRSDSEDRANRGPGAEEWIDEPF